MTIDLPPQYDPKSVEKATYQKWLDAKVFHAIPDARPNKFSIVIPPPNVTGALHLGHAINGTIQDVLTRYHRMKGDNTLWMPGIDHAGIATQAVVEKTIFEKEKKSRHDLGREELVRRIWEWKEQFGTRILSQLQSIGASCDWDRTRFTLDDTCAKAVREAFFKMFKDGLIFRGKRLVNWDTHLQTAVADDEIYHESVKGQMTSIKYPVSEDDAQPSATHPSETRPSGSVGPQAIPTASHDPCDTQYLIVATTRPETMLGDTAVAVHPDDPRYKHLIGKHVIVPLIGRRIPIIADGLLVDPKFGTGVVKVTPAHDPNDYATGIRHTLEQINLLTPDGKVNENGAGEFLGKKYAYTGLKFATAARKQVLQDLEDLNLIADKKVHEHEVGHSDRSKTPIEPYLSDQWFVRMGDIAASPSSETRPSGSVGPQAIPSTTLGSRQTLPHGRVSDDQTKGITLANGQKASGLAQAAMSAVTDGRVKITPDRYAKGYLDWLGQKRDWCISRQLWWGHRIPVWATEPVLPALVNASQQQFDNAFESRAATATDLLQKLINRYGIASEVVIKQHGWYVHICSQGAKSDAVLEKLDTELQTVRAQFPRTTSDDLLFDLSRIVHKIKQDPDVLDTWFSSALWPISTMGWPNSEPRPSGSDQTGIQTKGSLPHGRGSEGQTPEPELLPYFYPTSVLSTARDILTLWVARMVMFGLYCQGDIPFKNVYVHPVIQDGDGKIMSKSKGNGVDPVDIIASHGADALRFTLASLATETQDIRMPVVKDPKTGANTSPKFDIGRNFANKIWNASRFILSNITETSNSPRPAGGGGGNASQLEDRWILSRLNTTITTATTAINTYHFAELADALRTFFWTDLCDWYLEIAKSRIKSGDTTVQSILLHCLQTSLQLLHPLMPFITEEIWSKLPNRTSMIIATTWPSPLSLGIDITSKEELFLSSDAVSQIASIQAITTAIREIQNRYSAAKGKEVVLRPRDAYSEAVINQSRTIIESLASVRIAENSLTAAKPENAAAAVLPEVQIYIGGVIDKDAESAKLGKRKAELEKFIAAGIAKLESEAAAKAPEKVRAGWQDQLIKQQLERAAIEKDLQELQG